MLRIQNTNITPRPDKWRYPAVDGSEITANSYMNLKREVGAHYRGNKRPVPTEQEIVDWLCQNVMVKCLSDNREFPNKYREGKGGKPVNASWGVFSPMKLLLRDTDNGLGDVVARLIGPLGSEVFKKWYHKMTGQSCGCSERQEEWNIIYPR